MIRKLEPTLVLCLAAVVALLPLFCDEPLPYSSFRMYSTNPHFINKVVLEAGNGERLPPYDFGLHLELHPWAQSAGMPLRPSLLDNSRAMTIGEVAQILLDEHQRQPARVRIVRHSLIGRDPKGRFGLLMQSSALLDEGAVAK